MSDRASAYVSSSAVFYAHTAMRFLRCASCDALPAMGESAGRRNLRWLQTPDTSSLMNASSKGMPANCVSNVDIRPLSACFAKKITGSSETPCCGHLRP
jgi:hypothetical protein